MKLTLKNVGKLFEKTEIELNGITVITGINGSGKSTIGKSLFCLYGVLYKLEKQVDYIRYNGVKGR